MSSWSENWIYNLIPQEEYELAFDMVNGRSISCVLNQEEKIEGILRSILFRFIYGKEENINNIIVTDLGSTDKTPEILEKLEKDYDVMEKLSWKECKEVIEKINEK